MGGSAPIAVVTGTITSNAVTRTVLRPAGRRSGPTAPRPGAGAESGHVVAKEATVPAVGEMLGTNGGLKTSADAVAYR